MTNPKALPPTVITCPNIGKQFHVKHRLGSGGFADVYLVQSANSGQKYACKFINKATQSSKKQIEKILTEIKIHKLCGSNDILSNKHVVEFGRYWEDKQFVYILMKFCVNGSLQGWLQKRKVISEPESRYIIRQVVQAVRYLHDKFSIIHRDLKLGNILFDEKLNIKVCDFGLAGEVIGDSKKYTMCGTPNYIAPEIACQIGSHQINEGYSYGVDVWSVGVIAYTLLYGVPPFQTRNIAKTCDRIRKSQFGFPRQPKVSEPAKDLIKRILTRESERRLDTKEVSKHDFLRNMRVPKNLPLVCLERQPTESELFPYNDGEFELEITKKFNDTCVNVVKFVDYSAKYGIGYVLSNGMTGATFNDNTSLILPIQKDFVYFFDASGSCEAYDFRKMANQQIGDKSLKKRYSVFMSIANVIWKDLTLDNKVIKLPAVSSEKDVVYVRKWKRTDHAMIFKLNSQVIQTLFKDDTVIAINANTSMVIFIQKKRNIFKQYRSKNQFKLELDEEMHSYITHVKEAVLHDKENEVNHRIPRVPVGV